MYYIIKEIADLLKMIIIIIILIIKGLHQKGSIEEKRNR